VANAAALRTRTGNFAFAVVRLVNRLSRKPAVDAIGRQLVRCGTSVAANYRTAGHARSRRESVARLAMVLEEAEETQFWLDVLCRRDVLPAGQIEPLRREAAELRAIFAAALATAKSKR
jgi:four helix bundle protein